VNQADSQRRRPPRFSGGVIHQDIDTPKLSVCDLNDARHITILGQISYGDNCRAPFTSDLSCHAFGFFIPAAINNHRSALVCKALGDTFPNAAGTSGYQYTFAV
jgi:hypothetical protein